jgi:hypothetical protein
MHISMVNAPSPNYLLTNRTTFFFFLSFFLLLQQQQVVVQTGQVSQSSFLTVFLFVERKFDAYAAGSRTKWSSGFLASSIPRSFPIHS